MIKKIHISPDDYARISAAFWSKVDISEPDACWLWQAAKDRKGYGVFRGLRAARLAYYLSTLSNPGDMVMHRCDNPPCCNPQHLKSGTARDNNHDMIQKGRHPGMPPCVRGAMNVNAKLVPEDIILIRQLRSRGLTCKAIAERLYKDKRITITRFAVAKVLRGVTWKHV